MVWREGRESGQKLKIAPSRAEVEESPGTRGESGGAEGTEETEVPWPGGFTGAPWLFSLLLGSGPLAALTTQLSCALPQPFCPSWEGGVGWPQAGIWFAHSLTHHGPLGTLRDLLLM